jgi:hypothetical protein
MAVTSADTSVGRYPNFMIIGTMKGGTTSLYHYLRDHPQVFMPTYKAPEFFVEKSNWHRGADWYRRQFAGADDAMAVGEASVAYTKYPRVPGVPERIAAHVPDARFIYVVRNPMERIRSHYLTKVAEGAESAPLEEVVYTKPHYLDYSRYALQIDQYLGYFDREHLLILTSEDLRNRRHRTVQRVYEFLGVDPDFLPPDIDREFYQTKDRAARSPVPLWLRMALKKHLPGSKRFKELENNLLGRLKALRRRQEKQKTGGSRPPAISEAVREYVHAELQEDVKRLRGFLGPDFDGWGIA